MDQNGNMFFQQGMGGGMDPGMMNQQTMNPMMNQANMGNPQMMMNPQLIANQQNMMNQMMNQPTMMNQMMNQQNMMNQMMQMMLQNQMNQQNMMGQAGMMNQALNQGQINNSNINISTAPAENPNNMTVGFRLQIKEGPPKPPVFIQCTMNDKVSSLIQSYRNKTGDNDAAHEKFIYNAKRLNETLTVAEAGILNNAVIFVLNDRDVDGGI